MNSVGPSTPVPNPWVMGLLPAVMVTLAGLMPQLNGLPGEFVFDDTRVVEGVIERVRRGEAPEFGRRPVLDCSFWLTAVLVGPDAPGFRAINILIHTLAGLVLFAIVRSVAGRQPRFADCPLTAAWLAAAVAALWLVHPLNTQAVTYVVQRGESLMGLCYLLTIYCVLQCAHFEAKGWAWAIGAVVACLLGMGIKPVMISAPIMAMLFDRAFIGGSFAQVVRRRWGLYLGLGATWLALGPLVMPDLLATEVSSAGFGMAMLSERQYLLSQGQVISHYLRLSFWPNPLVLDYLLDWIPAALLGWQEWLPGVVLVTGILLVSMAGLVRNRWWAFCGAWFFLILGPTSSFVPIVDVVVEHRMYLSLIAVVAVVVFGWSGCLKQISSPRISSWSTVVILVAVGAILIMLTVRRNSEYIDRVTLWNTVVERAPNNPRGHHNFGKSLFEAGQYEKALHHYQRTLQIVPDHDAAHNGIGNVWMKMGKLPSAIVQYEKAVQLQPQDPEYAYNLGRAYLYASRLDDADRQLAFAIELKPNYPKAYNILGLVEVARGQFDRAALRFRKVIDLDPEPLVLLEGYKNLSVALADSGQLEEAIVVSEGAMALARRLGMSPIFIHRIRDQLDRLRSRFQATQVPAGP